MTENSEQPSLSQFGKSRAIIRSVMPFAIVLLLCVIVVGAFVVRAACREAVEAKQELLVANSNARQLLQQIYELANFYLEDLPDPTALAPEHKKMLSAWVACDESFLRLNQNNQKLLLERSLVARRAGTIRGLFGEFDRATKHLDQSLSLLEQCGQDQTQQFSYQLLLIECYGLLAWTNANGQRTQEAVRSCRKAAEILDQLNLPDTAEGDRSLLQSTQQITHASLGLGETSLAYRFGQAELAARSRLLARTPRDPAALEKMKQAQDFLELVKSRTGASHAL